jgi:phosphatidylglycerophosphate synthase
MMNLDILASQKRQEMLAAFWPRKVSRHITRLLVRTPITPNQTTVLWGVISVLNSYTVYRALTGDWIAIVLVPLVYQFAFVLDCVDGEIARFKNMSDPIGGKLLDGVCHRATEFSLLAAFAVAAYSITGSWLALPVGLLLMTGDAMATFAYERRLVALRVQAGFKGQMRRTPAGVYQRGMRFGDLTPAQRLRTITGLFHYKSVYAVIALSFLPGEFFLIGLTALGAYKHVKWIRLVRQTLDMIAQLAPVAAEEQAQSARAVAAERLAQ